MLRLLRVCEVNHVVADMLVELVVCRIPSCQHLHPVRNRKTLIKMIRCPRRRIMRNVTRQKAHTNASEHSKEDSPTKQQNSQNCNDERRKGDAYPSMSLDKVPEHLSFPQHHPRENNQRRKENKQLKEIPNKMHGSTIPSPCGPVKQYRSS